MTHEQDQPRYHRPAEVFNLTHNETLFYRTSDARFQELLNDTDTTIHAVTLDVNNYGEYLFVTLSREVEGQRAFITFYGYGFHEQRERWVIDEWYWYEQRLDNRYVQQSLSKAEANEMIQNRRDEVSADQQETAPSERAMLFSLLADMSDEDGAMVELEDLEASGLLGEDDDDYPF